MTAALSPTPERKANLWMKYTDYMLNSQSKHTRISILIKKRQLCSAKSDKI